MKMALMSDIMTVEVLQDGSLKISTDKISMPNHTNAEGLIRELVTGMGGKSHRVRKGMHTHTHSQKHEHEA